MKTITLAIASDRYILAPNGSTKETAFRVTDVPDALSPAVVIQHLQALAFWPHPEVISWPVVKDLPKGTFVRP